MTSHPARKAFTRRFCDPHESREVMRAELDALIEDEKRPLIEALIETAIAAHATETRVAELTGDKTTHSGEFANCKTLFCVNARAAIARAGGEK